MGRYESAIDRRHVGRQLKGLFRTLVGPTCQRQRSSHIPMTRLLHRDMDSSLLCGPCLLSAVAFPSDRTTCAAVNSRTPPGSRLAFVRVMSLNFHERQPGGQTAVGADPSVRHRVGGRVGLSQTRGAASPLWTGSHQVPEFSSDKSIEIQLSSATFKLRHLKVGGNVRTPL